MFKFFYQEIYHIVYIILIVFLSNMFYSMGEQRACNRVGAHVLRSLSPSYYDKLKEMGKLDAAVTQICQGK